MISPLIATGPIALSPDRFTPLARTPWAGERLSAHYKRAYVDDPVTQRIGEAWDVSCDPQFPSLIAGTQVTLPALLARYPQDILGKAWQEGQEPFCELMLKVLEASEPLSLQVHPTDADPDLRPMECGKPESWLVVEAKPGAGVYLGFQRPMSRETLADLLQVGQAAASCLQFVPVKAGDYFEIEPGVPHSLGPGVVILEPQRIAYGRSGMTYRLWDWGRRYNEQGQADPERGKPRALHWREGLKLIDPLTQVGDEFVTSLRRPAKVLWDEAGVCVQAYPANAYYQVYWLTGTGFCHLTLHGTYAALDVMAGQGFVAAADSPAKQAFRMGQPFLLPAKAQHFTIEMREASAMALVVPQPATSVTFSLA